MKYLFIICAFLMASSVWAGPLEDYCQSLPDPDKRVSCLIEVITMQQQYQRELQNQQLRAQMEMARQQALGMALFGSGNAFINGMNQGFRQMEVQPPQR